MAPYFNLCDTSNESDKCKRFVEFFKQNNVKILVCAHATLRNGMKELQDEEFNDCLLAIDEFHHTSADVNSGLGDIVRRVMNNSTGHIVAMTGSYFRGDGVPVLRADDEARFFPVTYNYYQQLNGYRYLKTWCLVTISIMVAISTILPRCWIQRRKRSSIFRVSTLEHQADWENILRPTK